MGDASIVAVSERMGSPNKVRIGHLSEKLVSLQDELEHEKQARGDAVELKLKVLDDKLLRAQISEEEKLKVQQKALVSWGTYRLQLAEVGLRHPCTYHTPRNYHSPIRASMHPTFFLHPHPIHIQPLGAKPSAREKHSFAAVYEPTARHTAMYPTSDIQHRYHTR